MTGLSDSLHQRMIEAGFDKEELEDVVQVQANIKPGSFGFEYDLLKEWTEWIMGDQVRREKMREMLNEYFYWHGKPWWAAEKSSSENFDDEVPWYTEPGMPKTPEEALDWFKEAGI